MGKACCDVGVRLLGLLLSSRLSLSCTPTMIAVGWIGVRWGAAAAALPLCPALPFHLLFFSPSFQHSFCAPHPALHPAPKRIPRSSQA